MQEIGRAGRDGLQSEAVLFYNNNDVATNTAVREEMREFCKSTSCRRVFLCEHFSCECQPQSLSYNCCDICTGKCNCTECLSKLLNDDMDLSQPDPVDDKLSDTDQNLQALLEAYFDAENDLLDMPNANIFTGLTVSLAKKIVGKYLSYRSPDDIMADFPFLELCHACNIFGIISSVTVEIPEC